MKKQIIALWNALIYSLNGLKDAITTERAFRQEVLLSMALLPMVFLIQAPLAIKLLLLVCNMMVLVTELLNSSIETIVDMVSPEYSEPARRAKDLGSAAVLLSLVCLAVAWGWTSVTIIFN